jgi:hypothetical protein
MRINTGYGIRSGSRNDIVVLEFSIKAQPVSLILRYRILEF